MAIASPPLPPAEIEARVSRRDVLLSWRLLAHSPMATSYRVEASLEPGGAAIAIFNVAADQTTLAVPGVPPGNYYVRVRALNAVGVSAPSVEQRLVVH